MPNIKTDENQFYNYSIMRNEQGIWIVQLTENEEDVKSYINRYQRIYPTHKVALEEAAIHNFIDFAKANGLMG